MNDDWLDASWPWADLEDPFWLMMIDHYSSMVHVQAQLLCWPQSRVVGVDLSPFFRSLSLSLSRSLSRSPLAASRPSNCVVWDMMRWGTFLSLQLTSIHYVSEKVDVVSIADSAFCVVTLSVLHGSLLRHEWEWLLTTAVFLSMSVSVMSRINIFRPSVCLFAGYTSTWSMQWDSGVNYRQMVSYRLHKG